MESMPQFALDVVKIMWDKPNIILVYDITIIELVRKKNLLNFSAKDISDESALFKHYYSKHNDNLINPGIDKAYKVAFIDQTKVHDLDYKEQFWMDKLNSKINLAKTPYSDLG